jgi:hypothetical protein
VRFHFEIRDVNIPKPMLAVSDSRSLQENKAAGTPSRPRKAIAIRALSLLSARVHALAPLVIHIGSVAPGMAVSHPVMHMVMVMHRMLMLVLHFRSGLGQRRKCYDGS